MYSARFPKVKASDIRRGYARSAAFGIVDLLMTIVGIPIVAIAVLFMNKEDKYLPAWAWLWSNDKDGDSDAGWRNHYPNGTHTNWWPRFVWFAIRNSCYNFSIKYGAIDMSKVVAIYHDGNPWVANRNSDLDGKGHEGTYRNVCVYNDGRVFPCYYRVKRWTKGRCWRCFLGWKTTGRNIEKDICEPVFAANPFMGFEE